MVPSLITLAITVLRAAGELQNWSPGLFNKSPGGGGALIGISWLILVFGGWFGLRLTRMGYGAARPLRVSGLALLVGITLGLVSFGIGQVAGQNAFFLVFMAGSIVAIFLTRNLWPELWKTLLAYAFAARIPVALLMLFAILGNWGTHYDVPPPGFPEYSPFVKWFLIGFLPQMTLWIYMTVVGGLVAGGVAGAVAGRK
ncbi:MAG: hypothetical protein ABIR28_08550 [Vicinamibacteria bacterium]